MFKNNVDNMDRRELHPGPAPIQNPTCRDDSRREDELKGLLSHLIALLETILDQNDGERIKSEWMTKEEVAQFLRESPRNVDRRRARGEIPEGVKFGKRRLFRRSEVEAIDFRNLGGVA
ncbi:MAG: helix-turn-helix domain-containing protein [Planctomycetes bacterium]|nr:helix-turn-helix domain-containing protein [Planctomycetota bacterium]